jgi:hypothetical protein
MTTITNEGTSLKWWEEKEDTGISGILLQYVNNLATQNQIRLTKLLRDLRYYSDTTGNFNYNSSLANYPTDELLTDDARSTLSVNIIHRMVDAITNRITHSVPSPTVLTNGSEFAVQQQAKEIEKFLDACFYETDTNTITTKGFRTCCLSGTGIVKVFSRNDKIIVENVYPGEVMCDMNEGVYGNPRSIFQTKVIDRGVLKQIFPDKAKELDTAPNIALGRRYMSNTSIADLVEVIEGWHLKSADDATDGMHVIICANILLLREEYNRPNFPFAFIKYEEPILGMWGVGLGERLAMKQRSIFYIERNIKSNIKAGGNLKVYCKKTAGIDPEQLSNDLDAPIVEYEDVKPEYSVQPCVSPDIRSQLEFELRDAHDETGISQLSVASQRPAGLNSGKALLVYQQNESERFYLLTKAWEKLHKDISNLMIAEARDIFEKTGKFEVTYHGKTRLEKISFRKAMVDENKYEIQFFVTSNLPKTPAGRLQYIDMLLERNMIDPAQGLRLLDFPDLESAISYETAFVDLIDQRIENILNTGKYLPPHEYMNLQLARNRAILAFNKAELQEAPTDRLDLLAQFIGAIDDLMNPPQPLGAATGNLAPQIPEAVPPELAAQGVTQQVYDQEKTKMAKQQLEGGGMPQGNLPPTSNIAM